MKFDASVDPQLQDEITKLVEAQKINPGIVEAAARYSHEGKSGFLLWHYVYFSEISFLAEDCFTSLFTSVADEPAAKEFDRLRFQTSE